MINVTLVTGRLEVAGITDTKATVFTRPVSVEYCSVTSVTHLPDTLYCLLPVQRL